MRRPFIWWDFYKAVLWMSKQIFVWHCRFALTAAWGRWARDSHSSTSHGVTRSLTNAGQKTLGWSLLCFLPQSHCSLPVHTPLNTLAFHYIFCISKHDLHCTVWGSVPVPAAAYSHQDQGRIKLWSELRDCCTINLTWSFWARCATEHSSISYRFPPPRKAVNASMIGLDVKCVS